MALTVDKRFLWNLHVGNGKSLRARINACNLEKFALEIEIHRSELSNLKFIWERYAVRLASFTENNDKV